MKPKKKILALLLAAVILTGGISALAAAGTSDNPLVTLSYLTDTFKKSILAQTDSKLAAAQSTYEAKLEQKIQSSGNSGTTIGAYSVVRMTNGQTLTLNKNCEVMLRSGTVQYSGNALTDTTSGSVLAQGSTVQKNHLYFSADGTAILQATSSVTILIRGNYRVK